MLDKTIKEIHPVDNTNSDLFKIMNRQSMNILKDIDLFKKYLDIQSIFEKYSVGNVLLILSQAPNTKQLNRIKQSLKDIEVNLIQPKKNHKKDFNNYKLYSSERSSKLNKYYNDNKLLLKGFLNMSPVDIKVIDELNDKCVFWDRNMNLLYIKRGSEYKDLFYGIAKELTKEELGSDETELLKFKINCISYMILKKYNIDTSIIKINEIPKDFIKNNPKEIREELNELKDGLMIFTNRVNSFFNELYKNNSKDNFKGR